MRKKYLAFKQMHDFLVDVWNLYRRYAVSDFTDEDLSGFDEGIQRLRVKYIGNVFASEVLVQLCCEVGRIANDRKEHKEGK